MSSSDQSSRPEWRKVEAKDVLQCLQWQPGHYNVKAEENGRPLLEVGSCTLHPSQTDELISFECVLSLPSRSRCWLWAPRPSIKMHGLSPWPSLGQGETWRLRVSSQARDVWKTLGLVKRNLKNTPCFGMGLNSMAMRSQISARPLNRRILLRTPCHVKLFSMLIWRTDSENCQWVLKWSSLELWLSCWWKTEMIHNCTINWWCEDYRLETFGEHGIAVVTGHDDKTRNV